MKRIRYKKTNDEGILVSQRNLYSSTTGFVYLVFLNLNDCTYVIKNITGEKIRSTPGGENINHLHVLKRNVKKHLEKLGVVFGSEVRNVDNSEKENNG